MTSLIQSRIAAPASRKSAATPNALVTRLFAFHALAKQRRALRALEPHLLADIGLTHADAQKEGARPLWDAPNTWSN